MLTLAWVIVALFLLFGVVPGIGSNLLETKRHGASGYWESFLTGLTVITALLGLLGLMLSISWAFMFLLVEYL